MNFADNLKRICTERGTSPTALLKSMGVATSKVAMWNSGSLPKQEMLIRLVKELDCSVYLMRLYSGRYTQTYKGRGNQ